MFNSAEFDHNRYLKGIISQIKEEGLKEDLVHCLCLELKFAQVNSVNHRGAPIYLKRDGRLYMMLYTSFDDLMDRFSNWSHSHLQFDWFLENLNSPVYFYMESESLIIHSSHGLETSDGIIIDNGINEFIIEGELLRRLNEFFGVDLYTAREMREMFESISNDRLEALLNENPRDWDEIIREIGNSTILFMMDADNDEYGDMDLIFDFFRFGPFGFNREISLSTSRDVYYKSNPYAAIVNFKDAVDHTLNFGLSGLTIKTSQGEHFMTRNLMIDRYELIERHCDDRKLKNSYECVFEL